MKFLYPEGKTKALTFSYDDGQIYDKQLIEIFNKYGMKATFHLNSCHYKENYSHPSIKFPAGSELSELYKGHEIAAHGVDHKFMTEINLSGKLHEVYDDKSALEKLIQKPVRGMSYAFGAYNEEIKSVLNTCGIKYSRTVNETHNFDIPTDFLAWNPTCHHTDTELFNLADEFLSFPRFHDLPIFYIWGHSFEFDRDNNFDLMEKLCEKLAHKDNIWYATNIEIYDYINAVKSLEYWDNGNGYYNPTATTVWIEADGKIIKVEPGQFVSGTLPIGQRVSL